MREDVARKILIIDDSKLAIMMLHDGLRQNGFEVLIASDGDEGLQMAMSESPDLIILDMHLPSMNGREFLVKLKEFALNPPIPVIILTASEPIQDIALDSIVRACYQKPMPMAHLVAKINECLEQEV